MPNDPDRPDHAAPEPPAVATQVAYPWRSSLRTGLWAAVSLAGSWAILVELAGVDDTGPLAAATITGAAAVNRVMNSPQVTVWLTRYVPWLAPAPAPPK